MNCHLSDDRLIALAVGEPSSPADGIHVRSCEACASRCADLVALLDETAAGSAAGADAAFPAERLARQHARIMQRVDADGRPAKIIAFPAGPPASVSPGSWRPTSRWIAAAALAGLFVGVLADQVLTRRPVRQTRPNASSRAAVQPVLQPVAVSVSDDEFLGQIEAAVASGGPMVLRPLDAMTPLAWDASR